MSDKEQPPIPASDCRQYTELPRHSKPRKMKKWMVVLPSLAINGGVREALEIAAKLRISEGISHIEIISMWHATHEFTHESILQTQGLPITRLTAWRPRPLFAAVQLPWILWCFRQHGTSANTLLTHYASFPMAWCVPKAQRYVLVQDLEWRFLAYPPLSWGLKKIILHTLRRSHVITVNRYLSQALRAEGIPIHEEIPIWADPGFLNLNELSRDVDCVMVLRRGAHKRLDLYLSFIKLARAHHPPLKLAVITPDDQLAALVNIDVQEVHIRPSLHEMRALYARSTCFIHLSEHEGFGLSPLEAMGAGCIPVCRDSGGIHSYMHGALAALVIPKTLTMPEFLTRTTKMLQDADACTQWRALCRERFLAGPLNPSKA